MATGGGFMLSGVLGRILANGAHHADRSLSTLQRDEDAQCCNERVAASDKSSTDQFRRLTAFSGTISALKRKSCGSAGSTVMRTQCVSGQPNVSTRVKFSNSRFVFLL